MRQLMATVILDDRQRDLLASLDLPTHLSTDMDEDEWVDIMERLLEEVQLHGFNEAMDGENEYGLFCSSVYDAMIDAEREEGWL